MPKEQSIVGSIINFRGMVYGPINEQGVVYLFSKVAEDLNMYVEEVRTAYPDCVARRFNGKGWEKVYIEFEFTSSQFERHGHDAEACDIIVCWEHDWDECPLEVFELQEVIKGLPNRPIEQPEAATHATLGTPGRRDEPEDLFHQRQIPEGIQKLYYAFEEQLLTTDESIWRKVGPREFTFYSPKRVFVYVRPQKKALRLTLFTRGEEMPGVEPVGYEYAGFKWGRFHIRQAHDIEAAVEASREAWQRVVQAVGCNEATGWFAQVEEEEEEEEEE
jgi:hypothetical protein